MKAKLTILAILLAILVLTPTLIVAIDNGSDATPTSPGVLPDFAILKLKDAPLGSYHGEVTGYNPIPYGIAKKIDLTSPQAQAYSNYLASQHTNVKGWLASNAPWVTVDSEYSITFNGLAVQLNGHDSKGLSSAPGVVAVYQDNLNTIMMNRSPTLINAPVLWNAVGGQSNAGAGIKIGIIDTGIDNTHPYLTDNSLTVPAGFPKCDSRDAAICSSLTSNKVIVAKVYNEPGFNFDAHAAQDHGTHVSGTAAGVAGTPCGAGFASGCTLSGIAPKAWLGNYNVFPGNTLNAADHVIARAVEDAVGDGMDVLNLSLGGVAFAGSDNILINTVNSAVDAGVIVAIAAGNSGPGLGTVSSPGVAANVITVGASTNPHFRGVPVSGTTSAAVSFGPLGGAPGQFANFVPTVTASYARTSPTRACTPITNNVAGMIALINRGSCSFSTKIRNAQTAGAVGVIMVNSQVGDPIVMGQDGTPNQPTIPAVMVSITNGGLMDTSGTVTVDGTSPHEFFSDGSGADILASFSSWGPVALLTSKGMGAGTVIIKEWIKPDVVAPGVNVYSSIRMSSCASPPCYAYFQGTSMATPHVAGSAAVLKQLHPDWTPQQVKSALANTAHRPVKLFTNGSTVNDPVIRGGGRIDLAGAAMTSALVSTSGGQVGMNFGVLPSSAIVRMDEITLTSVASTPVTYTVTVSGTGVTTDTSTLTLNAGDTQSIGVTLQLSPSQPVNEYFGDVTITGGPVTLNVPFWYIVNSPSVNAKNPI